jgi:uncharacterized protein (DUF1015 family)
MVLLLPVRAWHPDPGTVDPSSVICPVYDTVSEEEEVRFSHRRFNAARFVPRPHAMALPQFLRRSVEHLGEALRAGAFRQDPSPALYVYGIRYQPPPDITEAIEPAKRRKEYLLLGLVGVLDLDRLSPGEVALHERTFSDRVEERVALSDATEMSFAPIMAGYNIADHRLNDRLEELLGLDRRLLAFDSSVPPVVSASLDATSHLLWRLDDPIAIRAVQRELESARLLILDGHHRFTAARKRHENGYRTTPLVMLVEGGDRALQLLPWQRVLDGDVVPPGDILEAMKRAFPTYRSLGSEVSVSTAIQHLHDMGSQGRRGFLIVTPDSAFEVPGARSDDVGADFDLLHAFLEKDLGLDPHSLEFVRSPRRAYEMAAATVTGPAGTALLLPGISERGVEERAFRRGQLMAHKSTMFLPKVAEGVLFAPIDGVG